jgi:hypothetical protein
MRMRELVADSQSATSAPMLGVSEIGLVTRALCLTTQQRRRQDAGSKRDAGCRYGTRLDKRTELRQ